MAKTNTDNVGQMRKYQLGALAGHFAERKEGEYVVPSLLSLKRYLDLGEDGPQPHDFMLTSKEGVAQATGIYSEKFEEARNGLTLAELAEFYAPQINYAGSASDEVKEIFTKHGSEKVGTVLKKLTKAVTRVQNQGGLDLSDSDIEGDQKTLAKYKELSQAFHLVETGHMESLRQKVVKKAIGKGLEGLLQKAA